MPLDLTLTKGVQETPPTSWYDKLNMPAIKAGAQIGGMFGGMAGAPPSPSKYYIPAAERAQKFYQQQLETAQKGLEEQRGISREDIAGGLQEAQQYGAPYREAGTQALDPYLQSLGIGGPGGTQSAQQAFQASPGYQFALEQGLQSIQRGLAPRGLTGSGLEQKELAQYATSLAGQEYGQWQQQLAGLAGMGAQMGESAAQRQYGAGTQLGQLGLQYQMPIAGLQQQMGQSYAESELAKAQAQAAAATQKAAQKEQKHGIWGSILGGLGTAATSLFL